MDRGIKVLDEAKGIIEGLAIPFGGPIKGKDLDGEFFDKDTDFAFDWFPEEGRPVLYDHGLDSAVKTSVIGRQTMKRMDPEVGVWATVQLNMAHRYAAAVMELAGKEALGFSSGTLKHLIEKGAAGKLVRWPWVEQSLTTTPANPYGLITGDAVKHLEALGLDAPGEWGVERDADNKDKKTYAEEAAQVLADLDAFLTRSQALADLRGKQERGFSEPNHKRLTEMRDRLTELAARTEPAVKGIDRELMQYLATLARLNGALAE